MPFQWQLKVVEPLSTPVLVVEEADALRKTLPNIVDLVLVLIIAEILHAAS
jgi:hypothetical protein